MPHGVCWSPPASSSRPCQPELRQATVPPQTVPVHFLSAPHPARPLHITPGAIPVETRSSRLFRTTPLSVCANTAPEGGPTAGEQRTWVLGPRRGAGVQAQRPTDRKHVPCCFVDTVKVLKRVICSGSVGGLPVAAGGHTRLFPFASPPLVTREGED